MAISKYENEQDIPSSSVLLRLAQALHVKIEYFFRPATVAISNPAYRKRASLSTDQEKRILAHVQEWLERYFDIEELLNRSSEFKGPDKRVVKNLNQCEDVAIEVRKHWNLGLDPLEGLMEICEDNGIKISLLDGHSSFDALTLLANEQTPVIASCMPLAKILFRKQKQLNY